MVFSPCEFLQIYSSTLETWIEKNGYCIFFFRKNEWPPNEEQVPIRDFVAFSDQSELFTMVFSSVHCWLALTNWTKCRRKFPNDLEFVLLIVYYSILLTDSRQEWHAPLNYRVHSMGPLLTCTKWRLELGRTRGNLDPYKWRWKYDPFW